MMISRFLPITTGDTVLNYFALPLVGVSRRYFGAGFITTRVNREGSYIFVQVEDIDDYEIEDYPDRTEVYGKDYIFYKVPTIHLINMQRIINGRYSELDTLAKKVIKNNSGLMKNKRRRNNIYTSKLLLALDKSKVLVDYMYDSLKLEKDDKALYETLNTSELAEMLCEDDFI